MQYEVELKFPLARPADVLPLLDELGAEPSAKIEQCDRYFAHPVRDFAHTDEALRIRSTAEENRITYKGPMLDERVKTRREIEIPLAPGTEAAAQLADILEILGFREVRTVSKRRVTYRLQWEGRALEICLDEVAGLGTFLEIETLAIDPDIEPDSASPDASPAVRDASPPVGNERSAVRDAARDSILRLADRLGLKNPERRSYLALLLQQDGQPG